jgi:hypothetical protein
LPHARVQPEIADQLLRFGKAFDQPWQTSARSSISIP